MSGLTEKSEVESRIAAARSELHRLYGQLRGDLLGSLWVLTLHLGEGRFAVAWEVVERVVPIARLSPLPGAPPQVAGLLNLGGTPVPVVELCRLLGQGEAHWHRHTPIVVLRWADRWLGLIVDELGDKVLLQTQEPDPLMSGQNFVASCFPGPPAVLVLDHTRLLENFDV